MTYDLEMMVEKAKYHDLRSKSDLSDLVKRADVLAAIDVQPEFPGEMPEKMWCLLKEMAEQNDREGMTEAIRISVRMTKAEIAERVDAL